MAVAISEGFKPCPEALLLRNIEKTQKRCKKVLTEGWGCGIILERQGPPERMTSESAEAKRKNQYGYVEKTSHMFERIEKLLKKVLDKKSHLW